MLIRATDFLSWETLEFEVGKGVTLIQGFNYDDQTPEGSGKSAILNALSWGLYGEIPKEALTDDVIREGKKSCKVEIVLPEFTVFRSRNPNDLCIKYPNKTYRGTNAVATQKEIERIIGMSFKTFCQSIYFAQNYPNKFVTANQEIKGKILSEILDLEQFDRARKVAAERIKVKKEDLIVATKDVEKHMTMKIGEESNIESFKELIQKFEKEKGDRIRNLFAEYSQVEEEAQEFAQKFELDRQEQMSKIEAHIKKIDDSQIELTKEIKALKKSLIDFDAQALSSERRKCLEDQEEHESFRNEVRVDLATIESTLAEHERLKREFKSGQKDFKEIGEKIKSKKLDIEGARSDLDEYREVLAEAVKAINSPVSENCPTCGQKWDGDPEHYGNELKKAEAQEKQGKKILSNYEKDLNDLKEREANTLTALSSLEKAIGNIGELPSTEKLEKLIKEATDGVEANKLRIKEIDAAILVSEKSKVKLEGLCDKKEQLETQKVEQGYLYAEYEARVPDREVRKYQERLEKLTKSIEEEDVKEPTLLQQKLKGSQEKSNKIQKDYEASLKEVHAIEASIIRLEATREGYKDVKVYTFENTLNQLTRKANKYMGELFNQQVKIKFSNVDMKIDSTVTIDGHERPLGLYSGGQFRRIALAVDLALADITLTRKSNKLNLIILDEYFKDLSEVSMDRILKILQSRMTPTVLIEHNSIFKSIVNSTVEVELRDGISRKIQ